MLFFVAMGAIAATLTCLHLKNSMEIFLSVFVDVGVTYIGTIGITSSLFFVIIDFQHSSAVIDEAVAKCQQEQLTASELDLQYFANKFSIAPMRCRSACPPWS